MWHRLLGITILLLSFGAAWLMMELRQFTETPLQLPPEGVTYELQPGTSFGVMARDLEQRGIISSAFYLRLLARWRGESHQIKAGEYHLTLGTTPEILLQRMVSGDVISHRFTLVEGWTFRQVLTAIGENETLRHTLEGLPEEEIMRRLGHPGERAEGRFLADTYQFPRNATDLALLARAYDAMAMLLQEQWRGREAGLPLKDPYQALILASIVEKETAVPAERPLIAGVFLRRLQKGMKLQTDPTVIYGIGERFDGNIRRRDLLQDTPYNTYIRTGLTPTPICMPGRAAIEAVLHPAPGKALYFVAKGDGTHYFSATLEEHTRAVRKYQLRRQ